MKTKIKTEHIVVGSIAIIIGYFIVKRIHKNKINNETNIDGAIDKKTVEDGAAQKPGILDWPTDYHRVTSPFGPRGKTVEGASTLHNGIDIGVAEASPILAAADGVIDKIWLDTTYGGGLSMRIRHGDDLTTGYAHLLDTLSSEVGQAVKKGELVAESGGRPGTYGAGISSGPHLHFTVRESGVAVDPMIYLPADPQELIS